MTPLLFELGTSMHSTPRSGNRSMTLNYWQDLGKVACLQVDYLHSYALTKQLVFLSKPPYLRALESLICLQMN
jgi:hypothetical protein